MTRYKHEVTSIVREKRGSREMAVGGIVIRPPFIPGEGLAKVILGNGHNPYMSLTLVETTSDATCFIAESGRCEKSRANEADIYQMASLIGSLANDPEKLMDIYTHPHFPFPHPSDK
jgi:hypothetical protein